MINSVLSLPGRVAPPETLAVGDNLYLRRSSPETAPELYALFDANREHLMHYTDDARSHTLDRAVLFANFTREYARKGLIAQYEIVLDEQVNGEVTMTRLTGATATIGYWRNRDNLRAGIATQSVSRLARFGFEAWQLERIFLEIDSENTQSQALATRVGAVLTGDYVRRRSPAGSCVTLDQWELRP